MQKRRDRAAGYNTAGYVSGYRGSPLGTFDEQLGKANSHLKVHDVVFAPGINEDLAATAVWGSQQAQIGGEGRYDGVFAIWYGKGPGVDRSGDAFRHGNLAGSSRLGGVLVLTGDDHTCESSTTCHQSEFALIDAQMPVLSPAGVQELLDYGLFGWSLSRYSGCWVGIKCVKDTVESSASVEVDDARLSIAFPVDHELPLDGLNIRQPDTPQSQEFRLVNEKLDAARAFARANNLDNVAFGRRQGARLGIVTAGKSWLDLRQALADLEIDEKRAEQLGLVVYKVGMVWPLEPLHLKEFALGLSQLIVIEEKRSLLEAQIKDLLYGQQATPIVVGKKDESGLKLFGAEMALDAAQIAQVVGGRLAVLNDDAKLKEQLRVLSSRKPTLGTIDVMTRSFYFCAGCPHSTSTNIPESSRAYAGIGCSWMAQTMDRGTLGFTQMGAEGMSWVGEAPFSKRRHMFQNLGDGTYFHSGLLAIRAAVSAKTNITYKILFNDAVAMTGGQRHDGPLDPARISRQVHAEGVTRIAVVTDQPEKYARDAHWAPGVTIQHRDELDHVQRQLREIEGTTVLIYDQTCAAEKRRRRKRGEFPDPDMRLMINEAVCEGCGDCGVQSNCVAILPVETEFGRKRAIDQSSCNKDFSCIKGFCPSFVTVRGGRLKRGAADSVEIDILLPEPTLPDLSISLWSIVVAGVGGTGVVTIGALLGMAAHLEGKGCGVLDMAGLAQKGGSVWTHLRFGATPADIAAVRVSAGGANLLLGCDLVVTASGKTLGMTATGRTRVIVNQQEVMPGEFTHNPDLKFPTNPMLAAIERAVGTQAMEVVDAARIATTLCGDTIATNLFMLGVAYQRGLVPVGSQAIERAIEMNGAAVKMNLDAFRWGRRFVVDTNAVKICAGIHRAKPAISQVGDVDRRITFLTAYQNRCYADRYTSMLAHVRNVQLRLWSGSTAFNEAVSASLFKLMAYKDEYEVARLYTSPEFKKQLADTFEGNPHVTFNLAPPLFSRRNRNGLPVKREFGHWMMVFFSLLSRLKFLRGTIFDPFGYTAERRAERTLIERYEQLVCRLLEEAEPSDEELAVRIAALPMQVRGFGHLKAAALIRFEAELSQLLTLWDQRRNSEVTTPVSESMHMS
jgi:indolepyruvate ferredoxin oxidoreductase